MSNPLPVHYLTPRLYVPIEGISQAFAAGGHDGLAVADPRGQPSIELPIKGLRPAIELPKDVVAEADLWVQSQGLIGPQRWY